jgi:hypothetical protein
VRDLAKAYFIIFLKGALHCDLGRVALREAYVGVRLAAV